MIKFRYKRKEPNNNSNNVTNNNIVNKNNGEIKSDNDSKIENKLNSLKRDGAIKSKVDEKKTVKTKTNSEQEYLEDCIRAVVVSKLMNTLKLFL